MEKREQVFISSTYIDLIDERREIIQTLLEADCIPAGMELFPASNDDRWTLIKRIIDDCDYYVIVIGGRYGSEDPDSAVSYTEMEYDYAVSQGKPVMGFLHKDPDTIARANTDRDDEKWKKLEVFRDKVGQRMVKFWTTPEDLGGQVAKSLIQIRKTHPADGWVRASNALTPEVEQELVELRGKVVQLTADLVAAQKSDPTRAIDGLAHGDDTVEIEIEVDWFPTPPDEHALEPIELQRAGHAVTASWDEVFAAVAPRLIVEASEHELTEALNAFCLKLAQDEDAARDSPLGEFDRAYIEDKSFDDVRVQLFALGLIEISERKRPVADRATYWKMTSTGHEHMMRLRAIRSDTPAKAKPLNLSRVVPEVEEEEQSEP